MAFSPFLNALGFMFQVYIIPLDGWSVHSYHMSVPQGYIYRGNLKPDDVKGVYFAKHKNHCVSFYLFRAYSSYSMSFPHSPNSSCFSWSWTPRRDLRNISISRAISCLLEGFDPVGQEILGGGVFVWMIPMTACAYP